MHYAECDLFGNNRAEKLKSSKLNAYSMKQLIAQTNENTCNNMIHMYWQLILLCGPAVDTQSLKHLKRMEILMWSYFRPLLLFTVLKLAFKTFDTIKSTNVLSWRDIQLFIFLNLICLQHQLPIYSLSRRLWHGFMRNFATGLIWEIAF